MVDKNSFDCAATDLLCDEGSKGLCFDDDDDDGGLFEPFNDQSHHQSNGEKEVIFSNGGPDSEALMYLPCLSEECICWMVERERVHLPRDDYLSRLRSGELDIRLRRKALDWMFK
ncbi:UNVERIFIED_CONTAM: Cyclin-D4-2, partial [Sesamum indicum]